VNKRNREGFAIVPLVKILIVLMVVTTGYTILGIITVIDRSQVSRGLEYHEISIGKAIPETDWVFVDCEFPREGAYSYMHPVFENRQTGKTRTLPRLGVYPVHLEGNIGVYHVHSHYNPEEGKVEPDGLIYTIPERAFGKRLWENLLHPLWDSRVVVLNGILDVSTKLLVPTTRSFFFRYVPDRLPAQVS